MLRGWPSDLQLLHSASPLANCHLPSTHGSLYLVIPIKVSKWFIILFVNHQESIIPLDHYRKSPARQCIASQEKQQVEAS